MPDIVPDHVLRGTLPTPQSGPVPHESAVQHVSGRAEYIDDMPEPTGMLHGALGLASVACGRIVAMDLELVRSAPGVVDVILAADITGRNDLSSLGSNDDPLLAEERIYYHGQPVFMVVATDRTLARRAARLARIDYETEIPILTTAEARARGGRLVAPDLQISRGDVEAALAQAPRRTRGRAVVGGQEHFYLEGQIAIAFPRESDEVLIYSASQHPAEVQELVARILNLPVNGVAVQVRRMGGAFGGKESQPAIFAALAALAARKLEVPVKLRLDRDDDMIITGKRHDFTADYDVGFDDTGRIAAVDVTLASRCGYSADLSRGVADRAVMHVDNAYYYPAVHARSQPLFTNTVSNTAFRGYGGPQGIGLAERWIEDIAYTLGLDPLDVRKRNLYADPDRNLTPYHQPVIDNIMHRVIEELERSSDYLCRRAEILDFNSRSEFIRRGLSLIPVKFGIAYSAVFMNQGSALVSLYRDGSVHVNHGGTEMGQGIHTKIIQITAAELGLPLSCIRVTATATDKVPNSVPTSGSLGTDLNGMAVIDAVRKLKARLASVACPQDPASVRFEGEKVISSKGSEPLIHVCEKAWKARVPLSATGFYKTPLVHWDRASGRGRPYLYFTYGASCSEVEVDTLTGEYRVLRTDILQDVGHSINRGIDLGQIEGGFMQGLGWVTTEELWWDETGRLRTHAPSTYKIPLASDRPQVLNIALAEWSVNAAPTVMRSKAVGEPPVMLALSVAGALSMACASLAGYQLPPRLDLPATPERVLAEIERLQAAAGNVTAPLEVAQ